MAALLAYLVLVGAAAAPSGAVTVLCALSLVAACRVPEAPVGAVPFEPPALFAQLWAEVEACADRTGDFTAIRWYVVPPSGAFQHSFPCEASANGSCEGLWVPPHDIYLAADALTDSLPHISDVLGADGQLHRDSLPAYWVVRHEMLHDLLQTGSHPAAFDACHVRGQ